MDVPGDIAVAGFDDVPFAELSEPVLTTVSHPVDQIAAAAATGLVARRPAPPLTRFTTELIRRRSA